MEFISKNKTIEDLYILGKICFDTLTVPIIDKQKSDEFCGIYFEGRPRELNCIEDFAAIHSFKIFSQYNYPMFIFSPNSKNLLNSDKKYKNCNIHYIKIPECNSHEAYSEFMIKNIWNYLPKQYENLLFTHPDGFLIKSGWEEFVLNGKFNYIGSAWCHTPSIDIFFENEWKNLRFAKIACGNGGFSYRSRYWCEKVSQEYSGFKLRETGRSDNRYPPEDLFYSHIINGLGGNVAPIKDCMKFSLDPITLEEYSKKISFGFHYPILKNTFQKYRDYYLML